MRILLLGALFSVGAFGCSCIGPTLGRAKESAEIVFRGTITDFKKAETPPELGKTVQGTWRIAIFQVTRVWKGDIGKTFEMPALAETSACLGFWPSFLEVGNDLLVFASRYGGTDYVTSICTRTRLAKNAKIDLWRLGPGKEPTR